jgi:hypothetical protein
MDNRVYDDARLDNELGHVLDNVYTYDCWDTVVDDDILSDAPLSYLDNDLQKDNMMDVHILAYVFRRQFVCIHHRIDIDFDE